MIFIGAVAIFLAIAWFVADQDIKASVDRDRRFKHRHNFKRVGYGGAVWWLLRCDCGAEEIG